MSVDELVHLVRAGGVATITLDSPHNRNALSRRLVGDLSDHLDAALADSDVRVIVLTGAGPAFCSGADLSEQREANRTGGDMGLGAIADIWLRMMHAAKPIVCRVNGHARAGGLGFIGASDIALAADTATLAFSEVRIGVAPAMISVVTLPKLGPLKGMELMLTGEPFSAAEAVEYGLLNAVAPPLELDAVVAGYVAKLLKGGPKALAATKQMVRQIPSLEVAAAFAVMAKLSGELFGSPEALEGMTAFAEKRSPTWVESR